MGEFERLEGIDPPEEKANPITWGDWGLSLVNTVATTGGMLGSGTRTVGEEMAMASDAAAHKYPEGDGRLLEKGNVDLTNRPRVKMDDGNFATIRSMSFNEDGNEVLVPTISDDGRLLSDDEAIASYRKTGKHLGKFGSVMGANEYAEKLHEDQAKNYTNTSPGAELTIKFGKLLQSSMGEVHDEAISEMTPTARKLFLSSVTSPEFHENVLGAMGLKILGNIGPTAAAVAIGALTPAGPFAATLVTAGIGAALSASDLLDSMYDVTDKLSDEQLQTQSAEYKTMRDSGLDEEHSRRVFDKKFRANRPYYAAIFGALTEGIGPAGQIVRATKGASGFTGGVVNRVLKGGGVGAATEYPEEFYQGLAQQEAEKETGLRQKYDYQQMHAQGAEGALIGAALGAPAAVVHKARPNVPGVANPLSVPGQIPAPVQTPQSVNQTIHTGAATVQSPPPTNVPGVGSAQPRPKRSKTSYPKGGQAATATQIPTQQVAATSVGFELDPAIENALTLPSPQAASIAPGTIAARIEQLSQQAPQQAPQPVTQEVTSAPPISRGEERYVSSGITEIGAPAPVRQPQVQAQAAPSVRMGRRGWIAAPQVQPLAPDVAQRENEPLRAFRDKDGRRVLADTRSEQDMTFNPAVIENINQAERVSAPPKEKKAGHRVKGEIKERSENNQLAADIANEFPPTPEEQHLGKPGVKGTKARAAFIQRVRKIASRAKEKGVKRPGNVRDNVEASRSHSAEAILIDEAHRLVALKGKALTNDAITEFAKSEALLRSGDPSAVAEVLRARREKGDEAFRQKRIDSEKAAERAAASGAQLEQDIGSKSEEAREDDLNQLAAEGASEAELRKKQRIEDVRQEESSRRGTGATPTVNSDTAGGASPKINARTVKKKLVVDGKTKDEDVAEAASEVRKIAITPEERAKYERPGVGAKGAAVVAKAKEAAVEVKETAPSQTSVAPRTKAQKLKAASDLFDRGMAAAEAHKKAPNEGHDKQANALLKRAEELFQDAQQTPAPEKKARPKKAAEVVAKTKAKAEEKAPAPEKKARPKKAAEVVAKAKEQEKKAKPARKTFAELEAEANALLGESPIEADEADEAGPETMFLRQITDQSRFRPNVDSLTKEAKTLAEQLRSLFAAFREANPWADEHTFGLWKKVDNDGIAFQVAEDRYNTLVSRRNDEAARQGRAQPETRFMRRELSTLEEARGRDNELELLKSRVRSITYDRGLTRKMLDDPSSYRPNEAELRELRARIKDLETAPKEEQLRQVTTQGGTKLDMHITHEGTLATLLGKIGTDVDPVKDLGLNKVSAAMYTFFANKLARTYGNLPIWVVPDSDMMAMMEADTNEKGREVFGAALGVTHWRDTGWGNPVVIVSESAINDDGDFAHTLLHEGAHVFGQGAIDNVPEIRNTIRQMMDEMEGVLAEERAFNVTVQSLYAMTNEHEFFSEGMSNPTFQALLARTQMSKELATQLGLSQTNMNSLWDAFVVIMRRMLGMPPNAHSMLEGILRVGQQIDVATEHPHAKDYAKTARSVPATLALRKVTDRAGDYGEAARGWAQRNLPKLLSWTQLAEQYANTKFGPMLDTISTAVNQQAAIYHRYKEEYGQHAQEMANFENAHPEETEELVDIAQVVTNLEGTIVEGVSPADIVTHASNLHLGQKKVFTQTRHHLPELQRRYNAMTPEARALFQKIAAFYRNKHNELVRESVTNILDGTVGTTMTPLQKMGIIAKTLTGTLNETDKQNLGEGLYNMLSKEAEFRAKRGSFFPRLRYGDHVVEGHDTITDTKGGTLIEENKVLFTDKSETAAWKKAEAFAQGSDLAHIGVNHVLIDDATGNIVSADAAKSLNDVSHGFVMAMQTQATYMFGTRAEAAKFAREAREDNLHGTITEAQTRIGEGYVPQLLSGTQVETMLKTIGLRDDLTPGQKELFRTIISHAAIRMMRGNRISSRRLKSRKVTGASKDFARNLVNYGEAAARHIVQARTLPVVREQVSIMHRMLEGYQGKDKGMLVDLRNEVDKRFQDGRLAPGEPSKVIGDLMVTSYFARLLSPAYSLMNGMQVFMTTLPSLGGRFGNTRAAAALGQAYSDMGFGTTIMSGIVNTGKAVAQWSKLGLTSIDDVTAEALARVARTADGANLTRMLNKLIEDGAISRMAGFEVSEASAYGRGKWGQMLAKIDRIARQLPIAIEVVNRFVTAIAAYRLARESGMDHDKATTFAFREVDKTQGIYDHANAPRFFNNPVLRPWAQFKKYAHVYSVLVGDMTYRAFKDASPQERAIARKQLANVFAMQIALAGTLSLPGLELVKAGFLISSALGLTGGWDDQEEYLQELAEQTFGMKLGEMITRGVITRAIGIDVSQRLSGSDLWLFGEPKDPDEKESIDSYILRQAGGSAGSMILDTIHGLNQAVQGEWGKAIEQLPIKAFADAVKSANRDSGYGELALNTFGLKSAAQAEAGRGVRKAAKRSAGFGKDYTRLSQDYIGAKTPLERAKAVAKINAHNKVAPHRYDVSIKSLDKVRAREANKLTGPQHAVERSLGAQYAIIAALGETEGRELWAEKIEIYKSQDTSQLRVSNAHALSEARAAREEGRRRDEFKWTQRELWTRNQFNQLSSDRYWAKNPVKITKDMATDVEAGDLAEELESQGYNPDEINDIIRKKYPGYAMQRRRQYPITISGN